MTTKTTHPTHNDIAKELQRLGAGEQPAPTSTKTRTSPTPTVKDIDAEIERLGNGDFPTAA